uniref:Uncharacterized protein n=1 Tax=Pectobacterium versatile TaxID=2488639 RepID=A0A855MIJ5_9GAMM|nr:hypothetical protein F131LOC_01940 [Pectobacterium versatile]
MRRQIAVGTGGVDAATLMIIVVARPSLVVVMPARESVFFVVVVEKVIGMGGICLDQSALFILPVFSQQGFLPSINTLYLVQILASPHQQQLDTITVAHLAQIAFWIADQGNAVVVRVMYRRQE